MRKAGIAEEIIRARYPNFFMEELFADGTLTPGGGLASLVPSSTEVATAAKDAAQLGLAWIGWAVLKKLLFA